MGRHVSPYEQHPSQFGTGELRDPPRLTTMRILAGIGVVAVALATGLVLRWWASHPFCDRSHPDCIPPSGSGIPLAAWIVAGIVLGGVVVGWPWIARAVRRVLGRE